ncbi:hypothetical protein [Bradyrhizobium sp.]|uniref:hypothetical protein n=1 Tax=Bradyrhizobium sp. TaxID=376 RepID=UPI003C697D5D
MVRCEWRIFGSSCKAQLTHSCFLLVCKKNRRRAMTIAGQPDGVKGLATGNVAGDSEVHRVKVAKFAKPAIAAVTAVMLVGLYIGAKQFLSIDSFAAGQSRTFRIDISEACLHGTEPPPLFEAREGDRVVLAVTSLYSGELFLHGLEREVNIVPGAENTITFTAEHAGRFYLHLHGNGKDHNHIELAVLEVAPR